LNVYLSYGWKLIGMFTYRDDELEIPHFVVGRKSLDIKSPPPADM
jgi:hypothetical protein